MRVTSARRWSNVQAQQQPDPNATLVVPAQGDARGRFDLAYSTVFVALTLLGIAPIWVTDVLPLLDAASHQHLIRIMHDYAQESVLQRHYAEVHAIVPYLTYYKAVDWLMFLMDVETANRVVLSLCLVSLPLSASTLLRALDHNRWLVLGIFPWMLNSDFFMGFFNYLMSIPVFLWLLAAHVRFLRRPNWRGGAVVAALGVFLALTHYLLWAVTLVLLPLLGLVFGARNQRLRGVVWMVREVGLVLPSVLVLLPWFLSYFVLAADARTPDQVAVAGSSLAQRLSRLYSGQHLGPMDNLEQLFGRMFDSFSAHGEHLDSFAELFLRRQGELASFLWLVGMGLWLMGAVKRHRVLLTAAQAQAQLDAAVHPHGDDLAGRVRAFAEVSRVYVGTVGTRVRVHGTSYIGWVLAAMTVLYFALPQHLARPIYLYGVNFRLVEVLGVLAVVALPVCPLLPPKHVRWRVWLGTALLAIVAVMVPLHTAGTFLMVRTEYGSIREAMGSIPPGRNVLTLRMKRESRWLREKIFSNIGEYYAVFQGGYVPYSFADSSSKPIITQHEAAMPAPTWFDHTTFGMDIHGKYYDYIVIYRDLDERPGSWERHLKAWHKIYQRDHWQVYRNPAPARWPPPTPEELAREAAQRRAQQWFLERLGLAPRSTLPPGLEGFLDLVRMCGSGGLDADLDDEEHLAVPPAPGAPEPQRRRRRRRLGPPRPGGDTPTPRIGEEPGEPEAADAPGAVGVIPVLPSRLPTFRPNVGSLRHLRGLTLPGADAGATTGADAGGSTVEPAPPPAEGRPAQGRDLGPTTADEGWFDLNKQMLHRAREQLGRPNR